MLLTFWGKPRASPPPETFLRAVLLQQGVAAQASPALRGAGGTEQVPLEGQRDLPPRRRVVGLLPIVQDRAAPVPRADDVRELRPAHCDADRSEHRQGLRRAQ